MNTQSMFKVKLFYSYSHKDQQFRDRLQQSLSLLRHQDGTLSDWYDHQIGPGQSISREIEDQIRQADIVTFLISPDFIASQACMEEWNFAQSLLSKKTYKICIPIILKPCPWADINGMADIKCLPDDATPVTSYSNPDEAWHEVYLGIKHVIDELMRTFTIKEQFRRELQQTEFLSNARVTLQEIFVFPNLRCHLSVDSNDIDQRVRTFDDLLSRPLTLIHGEQLSGKTALCRALMLKLVDETRPVQYVDLKQVTPDLAGRALRLTYEDQFHGDYALWEKQEDRTIIVENLPRSPQALNFLNQITGRFDRVIATVSSDIFFAYYRDDDRIAGFREIRILPLTHNKQEQLIRSRSVFLDPNQKITDEQIDGLERKVNSIIINNRILPRYPFYILSILQTYEAFMPSNLPMSSYGHCHYVLIIAHLIRSGISKSDDEINSCFNFAENLAFEIYTNGFAECHVDGQLKGTFVQKYRDKFILKDSTLYRLFDQDYGLILGSDQFRNSYMYYYFLGKYLAGNRTDHADVMEELLQKSFLPANCLILISIIHHTNDDEVLDDILLRTICTLDSVSPAILDRGESEAFDTIISDIPLRILSARSVQSERKRVRDQRDRWEVENIDGWGEEGASESEAEPWDLFNDVYRILKNNEILGQVLRNKYGSLHRKKLVEIIETIADGGLRLIRLLLDQKQINETALFVHKRHPEISIDRARRFIAMITYIWTSCNIEWIVNALSKPEIHTLVKEVVADKDCPAYDLLEYFLHLDTISEFRGSDHTKLKDLLAKHRYSFFERMVSRRTQSYLNTHKVSEPLEQSVCSTLEIKYRRRIKEKT